MPSWTVLSPLITASDLLLIPPRFLGLGANSLTSTIWLTPLSGFEKSPTLDGYPSVLEGADS